MMFKSKSKKGFTLIELLAVIAILAVLVLLAAPKILGYTKDAKVAQIKNDVKAYESAVASAVLDDDNFFDELLLVDNGNLIKYAEEGSLFNKKGLISSEDVVGSHFEIDESKFQVNSKLKGKFFTNEKGLVLYHEKDFGISKDEDPKDEGANEEEVYLAKDENFEWVSDASGYRAANQNEEGYYKYIGESQEVIEIPHVINGHPMTSYYSMFKETGKDVKKVISTNKNITNMSSMFEGSKATELDLSNFDTSNVTDMEGMFRGYQATTLDVSKFDTSNVTKMSYMFEGSKATTLDVSKFNTSNVTNMSWMFANSQATTLDLSSFNTSKVTDMSSMFNNSQATTLDLSSFDTSKVYNMNAMFRGSQATTLDLSKFNTSNVVYMIEMFNNSRATTLDLSKFNTSNVNNMSRMFSGSRATTFDLSSFDTSNVTSMKDMFKYTNTKEGYARTQEDAERFNKSSGKPTELVFKVK